MEPLLTNKTYDMAIRIGQQEFKIDDAIKDLQGLMLDITDPYLKGRIEIIINHLKP
jgi:hypothetical protein